jgi:hypothetical protein
MIAYLETGIDNVQRSTINAAAKPLKPMSFCLLAMHALGVEYQTVERALQ